MQVNTISLIEQFMADALLSSQVIPLGVNVIRLAATQDEEGIARMARSMVVRYTGCSTNILKKVPLTIEKNMRFEIIISSQSYLADSGHDYALQMCAGSYLTLNNSIPVNTGLDITQAFTMTGESFDGLTDSSHYVYVQQWEIVLTEINPYVALDPCVARGNCSALFPSNIAEEILPGDVVYNNRLYSPVLPPENGEVYEKDYCGVQVEGDHLVYTVDPGQIFLSYWKDFKFVSTGTFDESGEFLICNIRTADTNEFVELYYAYNCGDRAVLGITARNSVGAAETPTYIKTKGEYGWANQWPNTTVYLDPTNEEGATTEIRYGWVVTAEIGTTLRVLDESGEYVEYYKVNHSTFGYGWMKISDITLFDPSRVDINVKCNDIGADNNGPDSCD